MSDTKIIAELPQNTVKLITATQIATSVSNIIKELVENSLDAGSTVVRVKTVSIILLQSIFLHSIYIYLYILTLFYSLSRKIVDFQK